MSVPDDTDWFIRCTRFSLSPRLGRNVVAWWPTAGTVAPGHIQGGRRGFKNWLVGQSLLFPWVFFVRDKKNEKSLLSACSPSIHLSIDCVLDAQDLCHVALVFLVVLGVPAF